jgi:hypothetical protein
MGRGTDEQTNERTDGLRKGSDGRANRLMMLGGFGDLGRWFGAGTVRGPMGLGSRCCLWMERIDLVLSGHRPFSFSILFVPCSRKSKSSLLGSYSLGDIASRTLQFRGRFPIPRFASVFLYLCLLGRGDGWLYQMRVRTEPSRTEPNRNGLAGWLQWIRDDDVIQLSSISPPSNKIRFN